LRLSMTMSRIKDVNKLINRYSRFHQSILTIEQFTEFGQQAKESKSKAKSTTIDSFNFLRHEVPIRLAHISQEISHLPKSLRCTPSVELVNSWYMQSFMDLIDYQHNNNISDTRLESFTQTLYNIKRRHDNTVETMAQGIIELCDTDGESAIPPAVQYFLDRFYMNRIGIRMLITQHLALHEESLVRSDKSRYIGLFDPDLVVRSVVSDAADNAGMLCNHFYFDAPGVTLKEHNSMNKGKPIIFAYVPSHLYHILFELLKNAMRATVEHNRHQEIPNIEIDIVKGTEDLTIKIADKGGGIPRSHMERLFTYHYTTAPKPDHQGGMASLAGYGYGLPLSRIYSKYFGGDIHITSMEGYGTEAYVFLKLLSNEAHEVLPLYNSNVAKTYKDANDDVMPMRDWSSDSFYKGQAHSYLKPNYRTPDGY